MQDGLPTISTSCLEHSQIFMCCFHQTVGNIYIKVHKSAGLKSASFSQSLFLADLHLLADTSWTWQVLFSLRQTKLPNTIPWLGLTNKTHLCSLFLPSRSLMHWCSVLQLDWWVRRAKRYGRKEGTWDPAWKHQKRKRCNEQVLVARWL